MFTLYKNNKFISNNMEINNLIKKLEENLKDVKRHLADYCYIEVNDVEAIIEYLEQLKEIGQV